MSTITVTPLPAGEKALSADVNATLTSWNSGTATGQIGATNVRMEGVDRRTMSAAAHVVNTESPGDNTIVTIGVTGPARSTGVWDGIPSLSTVDGTYDGATDIIVHAHVDIRSATQDPPPTPPEGLWVRVRLEQSDDSGSSWSPLTGTEQSFQMRDTGAWCSASATPQVPGIKLPATWSYYAGQLTGTYRFRVAYNTFYDGATLGGEDPTFYAGTIFVEALGA